jgi:hypothetical protein
MSVDDLESLLDADPSPCVVAAEGCEIFSKSGSEAEIPHKFLSRERSDLLTSSSKDRASHGFVDCTSHPVKASPAT